MADLAPLQEEITRFIAARGWQPYQQPKDLALSIVLEASELLEHFQWKEGAALETYLHTRKEEVSDECADVLIYLLEFCHAMDIDIVRAAHEKMKKNEVKYPPPS